MAGVVLLGLGFSPDEYDGPIGTFSGGQRNRVLLAKMLKDKGLSIAPIKLEGYLNIDSGTLNPYRHGEVFVLEDGTECDMDLGTYERMLEMGPERFHVKPSGLPAMDHLYDELPNFHEVLDDLKRQLALCSDSRDALELTPMLLLGPPGIGKTHFAREVAALLGTGLGFVSMSSLTAGWVLSGASSQWKGARPGKVFETLVDGAYANPVMVVDEIDKARGEHAYDPLGALYSLLEHDTAHSFTDEFAEIPIDAQIQVFPLEETNDALISLKHDAIRGAAVIKI